MVIGGQAAGPVEVTGAQVKFMQNVIKALKGRTEARAFLAPVDGIALGVPHYRTVITHPMDLGTIDIKLALTAAAIKGGSKATEKVKMAPRWGLDLRTDVYVHPRDFEDDVRLVFNNTRVFNGPAHLISRGADVLEAVFDKQIRNLPSATANEPVRRAVSAAPSAGSSRAPGLDNGRPKREIHPPPSKDILYDESGPTRRKSTRVLQAASDAEAAHWDKVAQSELKFCNKVMDDLFKPSHADVAWVFYDLPDRSLDYAPAYYAMIQHPICLTDLQQRLRQGQYADADEFNADVQLLFRNCFTFNPPGSDVYIMGKRLKEIYERAWAKRPETKPFVPEYVEPEPVPESVLLAQALREQSEQLAAQALELDVPKPSPRAVAHARTVLSLLNALPEGATAASPSAYGGSAAGGTKRRKSTAGSDGGTKRPPVKKPRKSGSGGASGAGAVAAAAAAAAAAAPVARRGSTPGENGYAATQIPAATPAPPPPAKKPAKKPVTKRARKSKAASDESDEEDVRVVTYEQKEELANKITTLSEDRLEGALKIIAEDKPDSAVDEEEIELDIDDLSPRTLYKLYRYVVRPKDKKTTHSKPVKNATDGRKRGTGGLKGKTLNESEETARIERLQAQLQQFEGSGFGLEAPTAAAHDDLVNSDSSDSESDLSGEDF